MSLPIQTNAAFSVDEMVEQLKSAAEPSRLRMLKLLNEAELTVSDLTTILGQSQPRVSRHLKLLLEARLIRRRQEGSWALFRLARESAPGALVVDLLARIDPADAIFARDMERLSDVKQKRRDEASAYFSANAEDWNQIRSLHVPEQEVEDALLRMAGDRIYNAMLDMGTGTGRMLELFAPHYRSAVGIDTNRNMLNVARANLEGAKLESADVRLGDVFNMPVQRNAFDLIIIHQVLHFLDDPAAAVAQAARCLAPGGRLLIVDFARHELEFLRDKHRHHRLGFETVTVQGWFDAVGLTNTRAEELRGTGTSGEQLTVVIWSADDPRMQIADTPDVTANTEAA